MLGISLLCLLFVAIIPFKGKQLNTIIVLLLFVLLSLIFSGNNNSVDQQAYSIVFHSPEFYPVEKGYHLLNSFFYNAGFTYTQFKLFMSVIAFVIVWRRFKVCEISILKYSIILWVCTSFWFDIEQSRFSIAVLLVIFATRFLEEKDLVSDICYCFFVVFATFIHTSTIFFIVLVFRNHTGRLLKFLFYLEAIVFLLFIAGGNNLSIVGSLLYAVLKKERILMWFNQSTNWGWLGPVSVQFYLFMMFSYGRSILYGYKFDKYTDIIKTVSQYKLFDLFYRICLLMFLACPLYLVATDFIRIERALFIPYFICYFIAYYKSDWNQRKIWQILFVGFVVLFNIQGLFGILFNNSYFIDNMLTHNSFNKLIH